MKQCVRFARSSAQETLIKSICMRVIYAQRDLQVYTPVENVVIAARIVFNPYARDTKRGTFAN